jgi:hypothetical protein
MDIHTGFPQVWVAGCDEIVPTVSPPDFVFGANCVFTCPVVLLEEEEI